MPLGVRDQRTLSVVGGRVIMYNGHEQGDQLALALGDQQHRLAPMQQQYGMQSYGGMAIPPTMSTAPSMLMQNPMMIGQQQPMPYVIMQQRMMQNQAAMLQQLMPAGVTMSPGMSAGATTAGRRQRAQEVRDKIHPPGPKGVPDLCKDHNQNRSTPYKYTGGHWVFADKTFWPKEFKVTLLAFCDPTQFGPLSLIRATDSFVDYAMYIFQLSSQHEDGQFIVQDKR